MDESRVFLSLGLSATDTGRGQDNFIQSISNFFALPERGRGREGEGEVSTGCARFNVLRPPTWFEYFSNKLQQLFKFQFGGKCGRCFSCPMFPCSPSLPLALCLLLGRLSLSIGFKFPASLSCPAECFCLVWPGFVSIWFAFALLGLLCSRT